MSTLRWYYSSVYGCTIDCICSPVCFGWKGNKNVYTHSAFLYFLQNELQGNMAMLYNKNMYKSQRSSVGARMVMKNWY